MKIIDKSAAKLGAIGLISSLCLIYEGHNLIGISGSMVGVMFLLNGFGYLKNNQSNQDK